MDRLRARAQALLDSSDPTPGAAARALVAELLAAWAQEAAIREARDEQLAVQRELLAVVASPILRVRDDTLCAPLIGPIDADRTAALTEALLAAVVQHRARRVVLDLSGAIVHDPMTVQYLERVLRAVGLLGARGVLSGVTAEAAGLLVAAGGGFAGVATFPDLAAALQDRSGAR